MNEINHINKFQLCFLYFSADWRWRLLDRLWWCRARRRRRYWGLWWRWWTNAVCAFITSSIYQFMREKIICGTVAPSMCWCQMLFILVFSFYYFRPRNHLFWMCSFLSEKNFNYHGYTFLKMFKINAKKCLNLRIYQLFPTNKVGRITLESTYIRF